MNINSSATILIEVCFGWLQVLTCETLLLTFNYSYCYYSHWVWTVEGQNKFFEALILEYRKLNINIEISV